jgi:isopenicillin-N N-acyltransferase like protein
MLQRCALLLTLLSTAEGAGCNGISTPGPRNLHPIDETPPVFVREVPNGKLYTVGLGDDKKDLLHLWGTPYQNGMAMGKLLGPKLTSFFNEVYQYTEGQIITNLANVTWCHEHPVRCHGLRDVMHMGLQVALNLSYYQTAPYIKPYVMEELQGLADSTHGAVSLVDIRNIMWLGEITRGSCSMFGAKDSATRESRGGKLLQLRALDWDTDGPFKNYPAIVVYHPNDDGNSGHAWANVGFSGWTASITGFSSTQLALSEIGVSYPDASFGPETYLARGYPFGYIIRDMLQFDETLAAATERITKATRTCDLILVSHLRCALCPHPLLAAAILPG